MQATYNGCTATPTCAATFEETLASRFPTSTAADFAPLEAEIVDEETYVEQGLKWADAHWAYMRYIVNELGVKPDLFLVGNPITDEFSHQFLGLLTKTDMDGRPNPYYDDLNADGTKDNRVAAREGFIRSAYHEADQTLEARTAAREGRDHLRELGSRLRPAVDGDQRRQGPAGRRARDRGVDLELPRRGRRHLPARQGLLGGRDGADLPAPRRTRPGDLGPPRGLQRHAVRGHPPGRQGGVPEPDRPGLPGATGHLARLHEGGAAERRRLRRAPSLALG